MAADNDILPEAGAGKAGPGPSSSARGTEAEQSDSNDSYKGKEEYEEEEEEEEEDDSEDEDEDEEPRLKYASLTKSISPLYRNGDATSTFLVAGDKMVCVFSCKMACALANN